jgi:3-hydroxyisobutyrate dehydrogenase-like beta-hydroxyacid dehydrogenase
MAKINMRLMSDAGHILSLGEDMGYPTPLPTIERAKNGLLKAQEMGAGQLDWSALSAVVRSEAGLSPFREETDSGKRKAA